MGDGELAESAVARIAWWGALGGDGFAAAIVRIEWDPGQGGSEELVWQALGILAGRSVRPA